MTVVVVAVFRRRTSVMNFDFENLFGIHFHAALLPTKIAAEVENDN